MDSYGNDDGQQGPRTQEQVNNMRSFLMDKSRRGNIPDVDAKCFMENTSYRNFFIASDFTQNHRAKKPYDQPKVNHKFRATSAYKNDYGSDMHQKATFGKFLIETI